MLMGVVFLAEGCAPAGEGGGPQEELGVSLSTRLRGDMTPAAGAGGRPRSAAEQTPGTDVGHAGVLEPAHGGLPCQFQCQMQEVFR